jgi:hypothetical protein
MERLGTSIKKGSAMSTGKVRKTWTIVFVTPVVLQIPLTDFAKDKTDYSNAGCKF